MADPYSLVRGGRLKLKGKKDKSKKHKKHKKKREHDSDEDSETIQDTVRHGSWWAVEKYSEITGPVAIEIGDMTYCQAQDDGLMKLGETRPIGEGPDPVEIFTAVRVNDTKVALKSGYDKYLAIETNGRIVARSDAIGGREQFEPVFQEGKLALLGCNNYFMTSDNGDVMCTSKTAQETEFIKIRSCSIKLKERKIDAPELEKGKMKDVELHYVKQFQSFQDRRVLVNSAARKDLRKAREDGGLHEALLDRRAKMKADRYCK